MIVYEAGYLFCLFVGDFSFKQESMDFSGSCKGWDRDYITPKRRQYISGIYCQLGDYMLPIPPFTFEPEKSIEEQVCGPKFVVAQDLDVFLGRNLTNLSEIHGGWG